MDIEQVCGFLMAIKKAVLIPNPHFLCFVYFQQLVTCRGCFPGTNSIKLLHPRKNFQQETTRNKVCFYTHGNVTRFHQFCPKVLLRFLISQKWNRHYRNIVYTTQVVKSFKGLAPGGINTCVSLAREYLARKEFYKLTPQQLLAFDSQQNIVNIKATRQHKNWQSRCCWVVFVNLQCFIFLNLLTQSIKQTPSSPHEF